jgi:HEAT repeat protein
MTAMLRDPVERVREGTAEVIAAQGTPTALGEIEALLNDANEVYPVKAAVLSGLGASDREEALGILISALSDDELRDQAVKALSKRNGKKDIRLIIDHFKDSPQQLREYIADAFKAMGESIEPAITDLLSEDISSLKELLSEILLKTGFIETTVKKLSHRKPEIRKEAAALLALIQTRESFKGIVLAARDPDSEVRVEVLKALEKLNTPEGETILKELKEDPDKRVRKYTLWAMERIEAKNLAE